MYLRSDTLSIGYIPCCVVVLMQHNKAGYEGFIRKRHEKDSWSKGRNIEYGGEAEADFMPEAEYQEQL